MREYGTGDADAAAAALVTWQRRVHRILYVALGTSLVLAALFVSDLAFGLALVAAVLVLAPLLSVESRSVYRTEAPEFAVTDELSSLRNPFTATWFEWADHVESDPDGRRADLEFSSILGTKRLTLAVEQLDPATHRFEVARDGLQFESTVAVEGCETGCAVTARTTRDPVKPLNLLTLLLVSGPRDRLFRTAGFEPVEDSTSVRPRHPFG